MPWSLPCHRRTVAPAANKRRQLEFHSAGAHTLKHLALASDSAGPASVSAPLPLSNSRSFSRSSCRATPTSRAGAERGRARRRSDLAGRKTAPEAAAAPSPALGATAMTRRPWIDATHGKLEGESRSQSFSFCWMIFGTFPLDSNHEVLDFRTLIDQSLLLGDEKGREKVTCDTLGSLPVQRYVAATRALHGPAHAAAHIACTVSLPATTA